MTDYLVPTESNPFDKFDADERPIEEAGPSLGARFRANRTEGFTRGTLAGAGGMLAGSSTTADPERAQASQREAESYRNTDPTPMEGETPLQAQARSRAAQRRAARGVIVESTPERDARVREELANYEAMPEAKGFLENAAAFIGQMSGGMASPESWVTGVPGAGWLAGKAFAGKTAQQIAEAAIANAAVNVATDPAVQAMSIKSKVQAEYEPMRTALAAPMGAAFGGGMRAAGEIPGAIARQVERNTLTQRMPTNYERGLTENPSAYVRQFDPEAERIEMAGIDPLLRRPGEPVASPVEIRQQEAPAPDNRPIVYHASKEKFTTFDPEKVRNVGGFWFGANREEVGAFGQVAPYRLNVQNPGTLADLAVARREVMAANPSLDPSTDAPAINKLVIANLEKKGFDGLHDKNAKGAGGGEIWTAFHNHQIEPVRAPTPAQPMTVAGEAGGRMAELPKIGDVQLSAPQAISLEPIRRDLGLDIPGTLIESPDSIKAFHGTPHDFDKFSMEKIGTGEGAQAYGHGLYFAENRGVAEDYRSKLGRVQNAPPEITAAWDRSLEILNVLNSLKSNTPEFAATKAKYDAAVKAAQDLETRSKPLGSLYEVRIAAKPDQFLDWDKPLREQSPAVRALEKQFGPTSLSLTGKEIYQKAAAFDPMVNVARKQGDNAETMLPKVFPNATPDEIARAIRAARSTEPGDKIAADMLRASGIAGIRYLDGGSRARGDGSRNYVVFDDNLIQIVSKNGEPLKKPIPIAEYLKGEATAKQFPAMTAPAVLKAQEVVQAAIDAPQSVPAFSPQIAKPADPDAPVGVFMFDASKLQTDAKRFQYKDNGDTEGVTNALKSVTRWDAAKANQLIVWQDKAGQLFVVDGHQRSGLARRLLAQGNEKAISIPGILYREEDGITPEYIRAIAAAKNIAEGSGSPIDGAKVLRSHPELIDGSMPITRTESRQAFDLARLGDEPFRMVVNEVVPYQQAAVVGRLLPTDVDRQIAAMKALARFEPRNEMEATTLIQRVAQSELTKGEGNTGNLFGDMMGAESTAGEEMRIVARAIQELKKDKTLLSRVVANADRIEAAGSQINRGAARSVADEAEMFAKVITSNAYSAGPVRQALVAAAKEVQGGKQTVNDAARGILSAVRAEAERSLRAGDSNSGNARPALATEIGADGKPQTLIPGVEPVTDRQKLEAQAGKPLQGGNSAPPSGGLFDQNARDQSSLFRMSPREKMAERFRMAREGATDGGAQPPATVAASAAAGETPQQVAIKSLQQQVAALDELFGVPFRQGRINRAKALGIYDTGDGVIRVRNVADFETAVHEVGHHLENKVGGELTGLISANAKLLGPLDYDQTKLRPQEGFAEWLSSYVTNPAKAERDAPGFAGSFRAFLGHMGREDVLAALDNAAAAYKAYIEAPSNIKIEASIVSGREAGVREMLAKDGFPATVRMGMAKFYESLFDDRSPVTRAVRDLSRAIKEERGGRFDLKAADNPDVLLRQADRAHQAAIGDLLNGVLAYHSTDRGPSLREAIMLATGGGSITGRFDPVALKEFSGYLYARRGLVLWDKFDAGLLERRPVAQSRQDLLSAIADYEARNPTFREASNKVHDFTRAMLQKQFDGGLIDADLHARLMAEPFYVPMFRDMSDKPLSGDGGGGLGPAATETVKKIKGSDRDVIDPLANIMKQAFLVNRTLAHNDAVRAMVALGKQAGWRGGRIVESVNAKDIVGQSFNLADGLMNAAKNHGIDPDEARALVASLADTFGDDPIMATIYRHQPTGKRGEPIIFYREGGELKAARFSAAKEGVALYEAFSQMPNVVSDMAVQVIGAASATLRSGVTAHPMFLVTNYIRDQLTQFALRPDFIPFYTGLKGSVGELRQSDAALLYAARGGVTAGAAIGSVDKIIEGEVKALAAKGYNVQRLKTFHGLVELAGITETGTRIGIVENVMKRELAAGRTPYEAMVAATWEARDSMDFGRGGSKVGTWTRMVPFLNAGLQGVDKSRRVMIEPITRALRGDINTVQDEAALRNAGLAWAKTLGIYAVIGYWWAWYHGEKDAYRDAGGTVKATHLVMPTDDGGVVVVPKPFEVGLGFNIGEEAYAHFMAKDPRAVHRLAEAAQEQLLQPLNPYRWLTQIPGIKTTFELSMNRNEFTKRDIVPEGMKNLPADERYTPRTSSLAKGIAAAANKALSPFVDPNKPGKGISPIQVEHIAGSLFGLYGRDLIALSAAADAKLKEYAEPGWEDTVGVRRLVKGEGSVRDTTQKFWEIAAARTGSLAAAKSRYEDLLKRFDDTGAQAFLNKQPATARSLITLQSAADPDTGRAKFSPDDRRLHPAVRGADAALILNGLRDELQTNIQTRKIGDQRLEIDPQTRGKLVNQIKVLTMMEMQNSLIALGEEGYAGRKYAPVKEQMEVIRSINPTVADEIQQRYAQKKIYSFDSVARYWPAVKRKLLAEGGDADLSQERSDVMEGGFEFGGERVRQRNTRRRVPIRGTDQPMTVQ